MSGGRLGALVDGLRFLHRAPDLAAMRAARSPGELAGLALIPAARNLGVAAGFLPANLRAEATAALLACRVLDAYEDLSDRPLAAGSVMAAVDYLNGDTDTPPSPPQAIAVRDSEAVDLVLAERIRDVRALLLELPVEGTQTGRPNAGRCRPRDGPQPRLPAGADRLRRGRARAGGALRMLTGRRRRLCRDRFE